MTTLTATRPIAGRPSLRRLMRQPGAAALMAATAMFALVGQIQGRVADRPF